MVCRKRKGGIKLDDDADNEAHKQDDENEAADNSNTQLSEEMKKDAEQKKELDKKQRVDSLWADFLKDTGSPASRSKSGPVSVTSQSKVGEVSLVLTYVHVFSVTRVLFCYIIIFQIVMSPSE